MAKFELAYARTNRNEGIYSIDPQDPGGETAFGISRRRHSGWEGWPLVDTAKRRPGFPGCMAGDVQIQTLVRDFYRKTFWDAMSLDGVNSQAIADEIYDTAVNTGQTFEGRLLQRALNLLNRDGRDYPDLVLDGWIGPKTLDAVNNHPRPQVLLLLLNLLQGMRYVEITEANPANEKYLNGWLLQRVSL